MIFGSHRGRGFIGLPIGALAALFAGCAAVGFASEPPVSFPPDPGQTLERTCFQTSHEWSGNGDLRSDVAIAYGISPTLPDRIATWRDHGYIVHVMTGVAWGQYQDYLDGRFDGVKHQDEIQTDRNGHPHGHGGGAFYMCPGTNYGKFLCSGLQPALDAGTEAIHLEEPEFWVQDGYGAGFKREWRAFYGADWQPPDSSVDAQWRASKLKYFLYRRALQQVFDYVQDYNRGAHRHVRCYVPTHSLLNYAHWRIVSPESSLARLDGCDGYIAQVWTGTSRTPNVYRGQLRERTFETAFLEYGAMQNLVRSTGRRVWYLNDPVEDNPNHDWDDYRQNWESTLTASLLQPEVWRYEVAPWPERVFAGKYPRRSPNRRPIPPAYATELQTVMNALNDMNQPRVEWDCGSGGIGVLVSDSLMFERGDPDPGDPHLGGVYGLAMPLVKRGLPVSPVQLENLAIANYLDGFHVLLLTYQGMKPLSPEVHLALAQWVKQGGALIVVDDDNDPYNHVREWWNSDGRRYATPRQHLFEQLGVSEKDFASSSGPVKTGKGCVLWLRESPVSLASKADGDATVASLAQSAFSALGLKWRTANHLLLRRGPYIIAAGLDESTPGPDKVLEGKFVNLFDAELRVQTTVTLAPGSRAFLLDLSQNRGSTPRVLASACKAAPVRHDAHSLTLAVEGVDATPAVVLVSASHSPASITLDGKKLDSCEYSASDKLLWVRFENQSSTRELRLVF